MMITKLPPSKLMNRYVKKNELEFYFGAASVEELIMNLRELRSQGLLDFDIKVDKEYLKWQKTRGDLKVSADALSNPPDPFGLYGYTLRKDEYRLGGLYDKINQQNPLTDRELLEVLNSLPPELTERYLEIKIYDVDRDELKTLIPKVKNKKQYYGEALYMGLKISGADVKYLDQPIQMAYREREMLRMFLERPEVIIPSDEFSSNIEILSPKKRYDNPHKTVSQLVSEVRSKLMPVVGQRCIYNVPSEGWSLRIE